MTPFIHPDDSDIVRPSFGAFIRKIKADLCNLTPGIPLEKNLQEAIHWYHVQNEVALEHRIAYYHPVIDAPDAWQ